MTTTTRVHEPPSCTFSLHTMTKPTKPTKPAGFALANPVPLTKWEAQREKERITLRDHQNIPHLNSTMGGRYEGKELKYRERQ